MEWSGETRGGKEGTHPQGQSGGSRTLALLVHLLTEELIKQGIQTLLEL